MSTSTNPQTAISRIGIIGAGPAGLAALKTVLDSPQYKAGQWIPVAFEAREDIGGIWLPSDPLSKSEGLSDSIPPTPLYDSLTTNLPHPIMAFSSYSFPPGTPLFPRAAAVRAYLADYAAHFQLSPHIRLNTLVQSVGWDATRRKWAVEVSSPSASGTIHPAERYDFDMVLICNGHHNVPRYPAIPGVSSWIDAGLATHSIFYRNPTASIPLADLLHATILVVGGGPSGQDVTSDLLGVVGKVIFSSSTNASTPPTPSKGDVSSTSAINKPRTIDFGLDQRTVTFADGTQEKVDYCILATGYEVDFPFFDQGTLPTDSPVNDMSLRKFHLPKFLSSKIDLDSKHLTNSTWGVAPLARHIIPFPSFFPSNPASSAENLAPPPTSLFFFGLLVRVVPLPLVECQARAALAAFAYPSAMDSDARWEKEEQALRQRKETLKERFQRQVYRGETSVAETARADKQVVEEVEEYISHQWQRFGDEEQFDYRDALDVLAHTLSRSQFSSEGEKFPLAPPHKTKDWERTIYAQKGPLRVAWRALEASGEATHWVEGVGRGGSRGGNGEVRTPEEEWVDLMWRILEWWETRHPSGAVVKSSGQ